MYNRYLGVFKKHYPANRLAPLLAVIVALSPFAIDTYLPAIPDMAVFFQVEIHLIELSIPIYLFGFAIGQLVGGPMSDNYGRRWIGIFGLCLFFVSSLLIMYIDNIQQLWGLRFIQAFGGGFGLVICAAIVRDLYDGKDAAKIFTLIGLMMMIAPLIAPSIGALLLQLFSWQAIFALLAVYALVQVFVVLFLLPDTKNLRRVAGYGHLTIRQVFSNYKSIVSHRYALPFLLCSSFVAATMFAFLTEVSFLYIEYFQVKETTFAWLFALNILSMMSFNRLNRYLLDHWQSTNILKMGLIIQLSAAILLLMSALIQLDNLAVIVGLLMLVIGSFGLIAPNNMACYIHHFPKTSGTANAIIGSSQFAMGGVVGLLLSNLHNGTPVPMFSLIFISSLLGFISFTLKKT